jgi:hypothetical protein
MPVMAAAHEAADARAIPAHHQAVAIVLDFVNPHWAGRRPGHPRRLARFDEAGGAPPHSPQERAASDGFNPRESACALTLNLWRRGIGLVGSNSNGQKGS